jgi:hypothetical protein
MLGRPVVAVEHHMGVGVSRTRWLRLATDVASHRGLTG